MIQKALTFDDILLVPQYSNIKSRGEIDIGNNLDANLQLSLPIIASPMDTVCEGSMASHMSRNGGLGIIHRYNTIDEQVQHVASAKDNTNQTVGAAVGVTDDFEERACALKDAGVDVICVDIAHGHHILMKRALVILKDMFGDSIHIMTGNVATKEGVCDLVRWGADSIRVGIGGGSICSTRIQTGHGVPNLAAIMECAQAELEHPVPLIADGGIKNPGDIVKALALGADFVMVGSLLAGTIETPGDIIYSSDNSKYKTYRGMASKDAQMNWRGRVSSLEGVSTFVPLRGSVADILQGLDRSIRSGFSYSGAHNIQEFREKVKFVMQTSAGLTESRTHIIK